MKNYGYFYHHGVTSEYFCLCVYYNFRRKKWKNENVRNMYAEFLILKILWIFNNVLLLILLIHQVFSYQVLIAIFAPLNCLDHDRKSCYCSLATEEMMIDVQLIGQYIYCFFNICCWWNEQSLKRNGNYDFDCHYLYIELSKYLCCLIIF